MTANVNLGVSLPTQPLQIQTLQTNPIQSSSSLAVPSLPVMVNSSSGTVNSVGVVSLSTAAVPTDTAAAPQPTVVNSHVSPGGGGGGSGGGGGGTQPQLTTESQVLDKKRLGELVKEVDDTEQLDEEVEDILLQIADDFIEQTVSQACALAKHRKAPTIDVKDVQLVLERNWNMWIPGFGTEEVRPYKRSATTEAHKQRMAVIRKALKKY